MERKKHVAEIKRLMQERKETKDLYTSLTRFLISKGVTRPLAEAIAREGKELNGLKESLVKRVRTAGELTFPKKLALVGPTGVGKTTTLQKLAEFYRKQGKKVTLLDSEQEIKGDGDLILIDTPGCNYYLPNRVDQIGELLAKCGPAEVVLTLSASTKDVDIYGAIHQFSPLRPTSLAFTKLDETLAMGILINVSAKTEIPIRYITYGYPLRGEIELADPNKITHKILTTFNQKEFNYLRQLALFD